MRQFQCVPTTQVNEIKETYTKGKSLAIYFEDSQFRRNRTLNFIVSLMYAEKLSRVRCH